MPVPAEDHETTLGLDLAAQAERTAACLLRWDATCIVETLEVGVDDQRALAMMRAATISGIDAPFGWPDPAVEALARYRTSGDWPELAFDELRDLAVVEAGLAGRSLANVGGRLDLDSHAGNLS